MKLKDRNESLKNSICHHWNLWLPDQKRSKTITSPDPWDKLCVISNHVKCQGDAKRFRIESSEAADRLFKAANFSKDGIHIRILFLKETGNAWVKDIMYRNDCMGKYISKFQHDMEKLLADDFENPEKLPYWGIF